MVLQLGHFGKEIRNTRKVLKCGAGEGWRSVGTHHVRNDGVLQRVKEESITTHLALQSVRMS
jgi:hypothetical protein